MSTHSRWLRVLALFLGLSMFAAACGDDDDSSSGDATDDTSEDTSDSDDGDSEGGGEFVDFGTFVGDPPEHIDPALNSTLDAYQVINAMYDGLTEIDNSNPDSPEIVPLLAESSEPNDDGSVWTFTVKEDQVFSNGEEILPSTFKRSWERAAAMGGDYSYLMTFIEGGAEALEGAGELTGVVADDEAMTLEVTLAEPYSNFDAVAGFQLFFPMPEEAGDAASPVDDYENGVMIGNGPYMMEEARTDEEIVLVRNDEWRGDFNGETWDGRLDRIVFRVQADPDTAYNAFEAGEADNANIPPARVTQAQEDYGTTLDVDILGSYHFVINDRAPEIGGEENLKLRQAISAAIDREEINTAVYNDSRNTSTGIVPPGIPGFEEGICEYCAYDPDQAQTLYDEWVAEGGSQDGPIPVQFNADAGHEDVVAIMVDNLAAIGIQAEAQPFPSETYFSELAEGACVICRAGWFADYPTYDNFMYDLFHSDALDGNNYGFVNEEFDALVDEAKQTTDAEAQGELFREAEGILLNDATMAIPINWYKGDYVYNQDKWENFEQTNGGLIFWERITAA
ncbi:MAG: peptide ABC transporter substrate-binding protein [Acidimicrobiales bacterium]